MITTTRPPHRQETLRPAIAMLARAYHYRDCHGCKQERVAHLAASIGIHCLRTLS
jgi:hypothetical protein